MSQTSPHLKRALGTYATTSIVIGSVVGSGIFSSPSQMARDLPSAPILLGVWLFAGILTLFGAFTQCELVGQMPRTGGLYEYFTEIFGKGFGFLYGWANFMIAGSGAIAAISFIFASYLGQFVHLPHLAQNYEEMPFHLPMLGDIFPLKDIGVKIVASALVIFLTALNIRGVKLGGMLQSISTTSKILAILSIVIVAFFAGTHIGSTANWTAAGGIASSTSVWGLIGLVALAMSGAFWAYDGWGNVAYIAGEVKEPSRTIPRAIIMGTLIFTALYMVVNLAYFYILSTSGVANAPDDRVASEMMMRAIGGGGAATIAALIMLSTFDTTNSSVLTNARVYYAMAHNGVFYHKAGQVHSQFKTPYVSLMLQGAWALVLLGSGSFGLITDMYVFVNWLIYVFMAAAVFVLRKRRPAGERPFRVPGYPIVPALFIVFAVAYVVITLVTDIQSYAAGEQPLLKSVTGLVLVFSGLPFYFFWRSKNTATPVEAIEVSEVVS